MQLPKLRRLVLPLVTAVGLSISTTAVAGDLSGSGPYTGAASQVDPWEGAYAGLSIAAIGGGGNIDKGKGFEDFDHGAGSVGLGGHVGYNFGRFGGAANGGWMIGTEFALSGLDYGSDKTDPVLGKTKLDAGFLASTRLRAGYAWDSLFLYGTLGLGFTDMTLKPDGLKDDGTEISAGLAFGAGVEFIVAKQWTVRAEAIGYDFGERDYKFEGVKRKVDLGMGTVRLGVSRQF